MATADPYSSQFSYYSGSQITVWFGNIYIDDIASIQWVRTQNKMPIYGYASTTFDAIANGTVLIQGNFVVNFRQQGYMSYLMRTLKDMYTQYNPNGSVQNGSQNSEVWPTVKNLIAQHLSNGTFGPQTATDIQAIGNAPNFTQLAQDYQNVVWGEGSTSWGNRGSISPADVEQTNDIPNGFNIIIQYGGSQLTDPVTTTQSMQSTTKSLNSVYLVGESQVIQVGGQPTQEQYSFIAKDTDLTV